MGNIATYTDANGTVTYTYDAQNQLLSAVNGDTTYTYTYDTVGNILTANGHTYTYGDADWKDLLTAVDGQSITYDAMGNPTSYYNGTRWTFTWAQGRRLTNASDGTNTISYTYDANGMRTSRTDGATTYNYVYNGGSLVQMTVGSNTLYFTSDTVTFNGTTYYYVTNLQGDIVTILNSGGTAVVQYTYDAWGNILSMSDTSGVSLGTLNPLRYRGYVYDQESDLYYLQSRYYDPEIGRFLNADAFASTGQGILGNNMFAYCSNNPVNAVDKTGCSPHNIIFPLCLDGVGVATLDYIIYYLHPESNANLDGPALQNHSASCSKYVAVATFEDLVEAFNATPGYIENVYIYLHGDANNLSFYYANYYSADDVDSSFDTIDISGKVFLFSCKGGRKLASTLASSSGQTVIASVYKVSFGDGYARCGWWNYYFEYGLHGPIAWYSFYPDGSRSAYRLIKVPTLQ